MKTGVAVLTKKRRAADLRLAEKFFDALRSAGQFPDFTSFVSSDKDLKTVLSGEFDLFFILGNAYKETEKFLFTLGYRYENGVFKGKFPIVVIDEGADFYKEVKECSEKITGIRTGKITFRLFGVEKDAVEERTNLISKEHGEVIFDCTASGTDVKVNLFYGEITPKMLVDCAVKDFILSFKDYIYAEDDVNLYETFLNVMRLRNRKVTTAESMTGGKIAANIISVPGASDIYYEGFVTYDTLAKERRLNIEHATVVKDTVVSASVAYEMVKGLLSFGYADVAISITGYAGGGQKEDSDGLCYIGVGVDDDIEVYKYKFAGTREEVIDQAADTAIFVTLKKVLATD